MLGLLSLPFGLFAPFAIWNGARSLLRIRASEGELKGATSAFAGLIAGVVGLMTLVGGTTYWFLAS